MLTLSAEQTRYLRLKAQRLLPNPEGKESSPVEVVRDMFGAQAQDLNAARLSIRARSRNLTAIQIEEERQGARSLVWTWCMRGTLHLLAAEDAAWLIPLLGQKFIAADRGRMRQLGWSDHTAAAGLELLAVELARRGEMKRGDIVRLLQSAGFPSDGQAPFHLIYRAALEGVLCYGGGEGQEASFVPYEIWLGKLQPLPREQALARLVMRFLGAYGPASPEDLASWSGLGIGEARQGWQLVAAELEEVEVAGQPAWILRAQLPWLDDPLSTAPHLRLLPRYDTLWLGYAKREWLVDKAHLRRIHPGGGLINPFLLVDGRAWATWKTRRRKRLLEVLVEPFKEISAGHRAMLEAEVADLGRFLEIESVLFTDQEAAPGGK